MCTLKYWLFILGIMWLTEDFSAAAQYESMAYHTVLTQKQFETERMISVEWALLSYHIKIAIIELNYYKSGTSCASIHRIYRNIQKFWENNKCLREKYEISLGREETLGRTWICM